VVSSYSCVHVLLDLVNSESY